MEAWPLYKNEQLVAINYGGSIGIVTCFTDRKAIEEIIPSEIKPKIAVIGNLYNPYLGLDYIIANVLANPNIAHIVVCGQDKSRAGQSLINLIDEGFDEAVDATGRKCWKPKEAIGMIRDVITAEDIEKFRSAVRVHELRYTDNRYLVARLKELSEQDGASVKREPRIIILPEPESAKKFPGPVVVKTIRGELVAEVWLKILKHLVDFGRVSGTHYQSRQAEQLDLISVISGEDPDRPIIPEWLPFSSEHLEIYKKGLLDPSSSNDRTSYTYGRRMRIDWGDQIGRAIDLLKRDPDTRRCVINLWDPEGDIDLKSGSPCLNHIWLRIVGGSLYMTATIRSNDMFYGYPENALGLRYVQNEIRKAVDEDLVLGELVINSQSAHVYEESWEVACEMVRRYSHFITDDRMLKDSCGYFVITVSNDEIKASHHREGGSFLQEFTGKTALSIYLRLVDFISIMEHALYIGAELQKAEIAISLGIPYTQDTPLKLE